MIFGAIGKGAQNDVGEHWSLSREEKKAAPEVKSLDYHITTGPLAIWDSVSVIDSLKANYSQS